MDGLLTRPWESHSQSNQAGRPSFNAYRRHEAEHEIEAACMRRLSSHREIHGLMRLLSFDR